MFVNCPSYIILCSLSLVEHQIFNLDYAGSNPAQRRYNQKKQRCTCVPTLSADHRQTNGWPGLQLLIWINYSKKQPTYPPVKQSCFLFFYFFYFLLFNKYQKDRKIILLAVLFIIIFTSISSIYKIKCFNMSET